MSTHDLINKQKQLMAFVPHGVRPESLVKMAIGIKIIDALLRYLNSTGHKPWRPVPLPESVQGEILEQLKHQVGTLDLLHHNSMTEGRDFSGLEHYSRQMISVYGAIEESVEYLETLSLGKSRSEKLEELTDILFFYLESMVLEDISWPEIEEEYERKWKVNMSRYEKAKQGIYDWDLRGRKEGL